MLHAQFDYTIKDGAVTVIGYTGPGGAVSIPEDLDGLPVIAIGMGAFSGNNSFTSITIPEGVIGIGSAAFSNCSQLTEISVPGSVSDIGIWAFSSCTNLLTITVDAANGFYRSVDGVLMDHSKTTLLQYPAGKVGLE